MQNLVEKQAFEVLYQKQNKLGQDLGQAVSKDDLENLLYDNNCNLISSN